MFLGCPIVNAFCAPRARRSLAEASWGRILYSRGASLVNLKAIEVDEL
jgi:hypothetical protein